MDCMKAFRVIIFASFVMSPFWLLGCSGQTGGVGLSEPAASGGAQAIKLTESQTSIVHDGVRKMIANPGTAQFKPAQAVTLQGKPGIHVCGYVSHKPQESSALAELPFYVELREENGQTLAHRGQVGLDEAKRAKVKFVCRHSGVQ